MKISVGAGDNALQSALRAGELEEIGLDRLNSAETAHDPLLPLMLAAERTRRMELATNILVAFARTPMAIAGACHDLNAFSKGRFVLGLGSQIKPHIVHRFSMPWSKPAARMKEYVQALHAIWDCWYEGRDLYFRGEFYTHTLMAPRFTPENLEYGRPKVAIAAVGPLMTQVAAEVSDGVICHAFTTARYLHEVTVPAINQTLAANGRDRRAFEIAFTPFMAVVRDEAELRQAQASLRQQVAFYASTPAYRGVLELHGWGELQSILHPMSKAGQWEAMGEVIDDEVLDAFTVIGDERQVAREMAARFGGEVDCTSISPQNMPDEALASFVAQLRAETEA